MGGSTVYLYNNCVIQNNNAAGDDSDTVQCRWIPDSEAPVCMRCDETIFSFISRKVEKNHYNNRST